jgi:ethanolamine ammonia-lyase small subunit
MRPGNPWDLKNYWQKPDESLHDYIRRFSKQCNKLPNIADADVFSAFLSGTTNKTLVHKLGRKSPCTTKELLDIATSHASSEEAVRVIFDRARGKAKRDEDAGKGASNCSKKKNKP